MGGSITAIVYHYIAIATIEPMKRMNAYVFVLKLVKKYP